MSLVIEKNAEFTSRSSHLDDGRVWTFHSFYFLCDATQSLFLIVVPKAGRRTPTLKVDMWIMNEHFWNSRSASFGILYDNGRYSPAGKDMKRPGLYQPAHFVHRSKAELWRKNNRNHHQTSRFVIPDPIYLQSSFEFGALAFITLIGLIWREITHSNQRIVLFSTFYFKSSTS